MVKVETKKFKEGTDEPESFEIKGGSKPPAEDEDSEDVPMQSDS